MRFESHFAFQVRSSEDGCRSWMGVLDATGKRLRP